MSFLERYEKDPNRWMFDCIPVIDINDIEKLKNWALYAINMARLFGPTKIAKSLYLCTKETLMLNKKSLPNKGKKIDFTLTAPYWTVSQPRNTVTPCWDLVDIINVVIKRKRLIEQGAKQ